MLKLHGTIPVLQRSGRESCLVTLTKKPDLPRVLSQTRGLLTTGGELPSGFRAVLTTSDKISFSDTGADVFRRTRDFEYLEEGDIVRLDPCSGAIRSLFRAKSRHNTILLTEQCNHYCLTCSQPPKRIDDSWLLEEAFEVISLMPQSTTDIGYSGGEPTLYGDRFIDLLDHTKR